MAIIATNPLFLVYSILVCLPFALIYTSNTSTCFSSPSQIEPIKPQIDIDDELLFEPASKVVPNPNLGNGKVAFMFLTTTPLPFAPLWNLFFSSASQSQYNIYIHSYPNFKPPFIAQQVPSKPTHRHTPTLISAARRLLAYALLHDPANSMFALLSPSCIPIRSFSFTYNTLINSNTSFIEILANETGAYDRWAARGKHAMSPEVEFKDFRIGSQFWVVKRKHAVMIVRDKRVWSKFKLPCLRNETCYPEEQYFPTLLDMVDREGCTPCTLTHVDWRGSKGGHPRMYPSEEVGVDLIEAIRKKRPRYGNGYRGSTVPFLFARKFSWEGETVKRLMAIANYLFAHYQ